MDWLHQTGVSTIIWLQQVFKEHSSQMLLTTHLGDPRNAFLLYFPLAYFLKPSLGVQVCWVAALSEYTNAVLKWLLHGERPYWWVHETSIYERPPHLDQFPRTCETGPGSPSGHAMVTAAVWHTMLTAFIRHNVTKLNHRTLVTLLLWASYGVFISAVCVSRCFISAHFPHQVMLGIVVGILVSVLSDALPKDKLTLRHYIGCALFLLTSSLSVHWTLSVLGLDPQWTIRFARKWCAKAEWVHLDTTPFNALVRDATSLLGLGIALHLVRSRERSKPLRSADSGQSVTYTLMGLTLSLLLTKSSEYISLPQQQQLLFYGLAGLKSLLLPLLVVAVIPKICHGLVETAEVATGDDGKKKVS